MAKCYFAKHKLVWEILEGGLKSKIEIQWSDIMGLKASCPENGPGSLTLVVRHKFPTYFFLMTLVSRASLGAPLLNLRESMNSYQHNYWTTLPQDFGHMGSNHLVFFVSLGI